MSINKLAITGASGVIGVKMVMSLPSDINVVNLYRSRPLRVDRFRKVENVKLDLANSNEIDQTLYKLRPDCVVHLAAATHIDECEKDRKSGKKGLVWKVNVDATHEIAKYCASTGAYLMYFSTECVFDGESKIYDEDSHPNPKNWYGLTKYEGEKRILAVCRNSTIIRSVMAYDSDANSGTIFGKILESLSEGKEVMGVYDQHITPTYIPDIVAGSLHILSRQLNGIFHIVPKDIITPFEFARKIAKHYGYKQSLVKKKTLVEYFGEERAALRLKHSCLKGEKTARITGYHPKHIDMVLRGLAL